MSSNSVDFDVTIVKEELEENCYENDTATRATAQMLQENIKVEVKIEDWPIEMANDPQPNTKSGKTQDDEAHDEDDEPVESRSQTRDASDDISEDSNAGHNSSLIASNQCHLCSISLPSLLYKNHMLDHSRVKKIRCVTCDTLYLDKERFSAHMLNNHADKKTIQCKLCSRKFSEINLLEFHMAVHSSETFSCDYCKENFDFKSLLTVHMRKHIGGKVHVCDKCQKEFESPTALKRHKTTHTGAKDFVCDICGVKFSRMSHLNRHKKQHQRAK